MEKMKEEGQVHGPRAEIEGLASAPHLKLIIMPDNT